MHYALAVLSSNSDGVLHVRSTTLFSIPLRVVPSLSDKSVLQHNVGGFSPSTKLDTYHHNA
jgi:hypothetical protein